MSDSVTRESIAPVRRPWEITLLVILGYLGGLFNLLTGIFVMLDKNNEEFLQGIYYTENQLIWIGLLVALVGVVQIFLANLLGRGSQLVRILYAVIAVFNLAGGLWAMVALNSEQRASGVVATVIAVVVLWLLFNQKSDEFFENA